MYCMIDHDTVLAKEKSMSNQQIDDAFNSMLRTNYIPLKDTNKLNLLASMGQVRTSSSTCAILRGPAV
jgi:hypothetical protein